MDWAMAMFNMDAIFFISELGKQEALKVGIKAEHLLVGADTVSWRPAFPEEKKQIRDGLGIPQDAFVILTVADNQERKNLWAGFRTIKHLKESIDRPIRYILVTREHSPFGYRLRSLAVTENINQELMIFERGVPQKELWGLYAISDVYLQPSKAEGLGLPVMDAMCCKIPVVATRTGAMIELLEKGRGFLVPGYTFDGEQHFTDVWGNSDRVMMDVIHAKTNLQDIASGLYYKESVEDAYEYIKGRTWDIPAKQLSEKIEELCQNQQ
jgi:glycosyltransferase involved in cell wall biosynthesis